MHFLRLVMTAVVVLGVGWASAPRSEPLSFGDPRLAAAVDSVASVNGVSPERLRVDPAALEFMGRLAGSFRIQEYLTREPLRATGTLTAVARELAAGDGLASRIRSMAEVARTRPPDRRPPVFRPGEKEGIFSAADPLESAMERLFDGTRERFQGKDRERLRRESMSLDPPTREALARLLLGVKEAAEIREGVVKDSDFKSGGAFGARSKGTADLLRTYVARWQGQGTEVDQAGLRTTAAVTTLDLDGLYEGATALARSVDSALVVLGADTGPAEDFQFEWNTPFGPIGVGGRGENTYLGHHCLVLDLGGDDHYTGPGGVSGQEAVSVVVDLSGNDTYAAADSARSGPGGAILGYAGVVDRGDGDDVYDAVSWSAGFGFLGVGWIWDGGGNDRYAVQWLGEGAAVFGLGLLLDESGDDTYLLHKPNQDFPVGRAQGFAGPSGMGVLLDLAGSDDLKVEPSLIRMEDAEPTYQQGSAAGYPGRFFGGLGLLVNGAGIDRYDAGAVSMGAGVDGGLGVLIEFEGTDHYRGTSRDMGYGRERGMGVLIELDGRDTYNLRGRPALSLGYGDDLGTGMLEEHSGNDSYNFMEGSLGSSTRQGAGWFVDLAGEDHYEEIRRAQVGQVDPGEGPAWRAAVPGVAVFLDLEQENFPRFALAPGSYFSARGDGPRLGGGVFGPRPVSAEGDSR